MRDISDESIPGVEIQGYNGQKNYTIVGQTIQALYFSFIFGKYSY